MIELFALNCIFLYINCTFVVDLVHTSFIERGQWLKPAAIDKRNLSIIKTTCIRQPHNYIDGTHYTTTLFYKTYAPTQRAIKNHLSPTRYSFVTHMAWAKYSFDLHPEISEHRRKVSKPYFKNSPKLKSDSVSTVQTELGEVNDSKAQNIKVVMETKCL